MTSINKKIVLTGGPSAGKTTVASAIERCHAGQVIKVPEAATILFGGGFFRSQKPEGVAHQQKAIFRVQSEHEKIFHLEYPNRVLVCDRGTLDGYAYWPEDQGDFFEVMETTLDAELANYDLVIHLDSANGNDYDFANQLRIETAEEAHKINARVKKIWEQ
ncbi:MAG: ATP-binding protein, partial [Bdellovibrionales bacterium]|nr:ATP-binding protein [Bdellovibrionales bacterium]